MLHHPEYIHLLAVPAIHYHASEALVLMSSGLHLFLLEQSSLEILHCGVL